MLLFPVSSIIFLNWLFVLEHFFFSKFAPSDGHVDIHYMNLRIDNLRLHHRWFLCSLHSFVFKHIMHVIELRTIYNLMPDLTIDMIRTPHRSMYFELLNGNLINYKTIFSFLLTLHVSTL
jgi:hypothetical protein